MRDSTVFVTIECGRVVAKYEDSGGVNLSRRIESKEDFDGFIGSLKAARSAEFGSPCPRIDVLLSSSIDFPEDWTSHQPTIELCRHIRT
jgi:hypothetical protein